MKNVLLCCGLLVKHHKYEFSISEGLHHVSKVLGVDTTDTRLGFYLISFLLEVGFTLPLSDFIWDVLYDFNVAPRQHTNLS